MKEKVLVDTDIFIDLLRGEQNANEFFHRIESNEYDAAVSVLTEAELYSGKTSSSTVEQLKISTLLSLFKVIVIDRDIAREAGRIRRDFDVPFSDSLIAASALSNNAKNILSRNEKHYSKIKDINFKKPY